MSNTPKIMVFRLKELIYTAIFILLAILLIIFLVKMFNSDKNGNSNNKETSSLESSSMENSSVEVSSEDVSSEVTSSENTSLNNSSTKETSSETTAPPKKTPKKNYSPGVYTSSLVLNNSALEVQVNVDLDSINSISIKNMDEAITTMYPLMSSSIKDLENQIIASQSLENITYSSENRYTYMVLLDAISSALSKAEKSN